MEARVADLWREFEDEADAVDQLLSRGATGREEGAEQRLEQGRLRSSDCPHPAANDPAHGARSAMTYLPPIDAPDIA